MPSDVKPPKPWEAVRAVHAMLLLRHPSLFDLKNPVPFCLAFGMDVRRLYPEVPPAVLQRLMEWLTCRRAYLASCKEGAPRHGFDGPDGVVNSGQASWARGLFRRRNAKAKDKWEIAG